MFFNHSSSALDTSENAIGLNDKIDTLELQIREKNIIIKEKAEEAVKHKLYNKKSAQTITRLGLLVDQNKQIIRTLQQEVKKYN